MSIKIEMIVDSVSHEAPFMPGISHSFGPYSKPENYPIFLSLVPTADRKELLVGRTPDAEEIYESPREKIRITTGNEEKDAEIVRPYIGNVPRGMMFPPIPMVVLLTVEDYKKLGKPSIGDRLRIQAQSIFGALFT